MGTQKGTTSPTTPTPSKTTTPDNIVNQEGWGEYSSKRLNYSFKYPKDWYFFPYKEDDPQVLFGAHTLSNYSPTEVEKYMDHGIVDWKKFLGNKVSIKIDFAVYSKNVQNIDPQTYSKNIVGENGPQPLNSSNLKIGDIITYQYQVPSSQSPEEKYNIYLAFPDKERVIYLALYYQNISSLEELGETSEWNRLKEILSTFKFSAQPTSPPSNLKTHSDPAYKFVLKYSDTYKATSDKYGWPKAIFILYKDGQSYDLVVEVWDDEAGYKAKYNNQLDTITVKQMTNGKFLTLLNMNKDPEVDQIISTFKALE